MPGRSRPHRMRALVYKGPQDVRVEEVPDARIEEPTDALVRMTSSGICGSDLHMYEGRTAVKPGTVLGHEPMGVVLDVGPAVRLVKKGDRVVIPFNIPCGSCLNCIRGFTSGCLTTNPANAGAAYGYAQMGPHRGAQAELLRVPYADLACLKLPGKPGDGMEDDFLLLSDVFPTGFHATELAMVQPGSTVAIFGAGPVGLLAAHSAALRGAAEIYVVDKSGARLSLAKRQGAIPIDFTKGDPAEQIVELRRKNKELQQALRPGEEKMPGVMCAIDAVGYQAFGRDGEKAEPSRVLMDIAKVINATGTVGLIGVYTHNDPGAKDAAERKGEIALPIGELWSKGVTIGMGQTPVKSYHYQLRDLIMAKKARPGAIVSHRISLEDAPKLYKEFDKRDKVTKAIVRFV